MQTSVVSIYAINTAELHTMVWTLAIIVGILAVVALLWNVYRNLSGGMNGQSCEENDIQKQRRKYNRRIHELVTKRTGKDRRQGRED